MKNSQVNFRIESELLDEIKQAAEATGKPYSQWIIELCQEKLGRKAISLEDVSERLEKVETEITELKKAKVTTPPPEDNESDRTPEGLTHTQLAKKLGVASSTVSRWATGKRRTPEDLKYKFDQSLKLWVRCHH